MTFFWQNPSAALLSRSGMLGENPSAWHYNQRDYKFYVVDNTAGSSATHFRKIRSGWEYREDANDGRKEEPDAEYLKVYARAGLKKLGLDPDNNAQWMSSAEVLHATSSRVAGRREWEADMESMPPADSPHWRENPKKKPRPKTAGY